ncbi:UDP-N-acetylmuramoylalanine--D-glutamate ligase [bacterium BMS3Abin06]|nr:UDP-N-acetylmuramoylalanine--D-glutamate ligase [bacterium BMS3Abin06]
MDEKKKNNFKDKKILVVGLARSGIGAANLLSSSGVSVTVTDRKSRSSLEDQIRKLWPSVKVITDGNQEEVFDVSGMIVVSPGVPLDIPPLIRARAKGIPVIGELELAYQVVTGETRNSELATPAFIGVTGTNGKSTTTTLVDLMLKKSGLKTLLGGNIGTALTEELLKAVSGQQSAVSEIPVTEGCQLNADYIVAEISSFQLEAIKEFRPGIGAILNITPDHLDRYDSMNDYINAKARIFENQTSEDYLVLNADDPVIMKMANEKLKMRNKELPRIAYFSREKEVEGVYFKGGKIYCNFHNPGLQTLNSELIGVDEIRIKGVHNLENTMAASLVAIISGCSYEAVKKVLRDFPGLEHRLEFAGEVNGVKFINDSKGTNAGAVAKSLEGFENVFLIMGGMDKGSDFSVLRNLIRKKVKLLILLGEAKEKIAQAIGGAAEIRKVRDLKEAINLSISKASAGDVVLLSPGCASFDMFADFEDRGRKFKDAVKGISNEKDRLKCI